MALDPPPPPLTPAEEEHYRWLVRGLVTGLLRRNGHDEVLSRALLELEELLEELLGRTLTV